MLVLSRKKGEGILIGRLGRVTILEVRGNRVRIGIECPTHVMVHREETYRRIEAPKHADCVEQETSL